MEKWTQKSQLLRNVVLLICALSFGFSPLTAKPANAQGGIIGSVVGIAGCLDLSGIFGDITDSFENSGKVPVTDSVTQDNTASIQENTGASLNKECVLDGIAYGLAKEVSKQLTDNVLTFIKGDFKNGPAFVNNPSQFFKKISDSVINDIVTGSELEFLCSPFQDIIRKSIKIEYQKYSSSTFKDRVRCTLDDIEQNVVDFQNNNFENGSLSDLLEISLVPQNNPLGAYILVSNELDSRLANTIETEKQQLEINNGFKSVRNANGDIVTPGIVIEGQLQKILGQGIDQLNVADELDEVIDALVGKMTNRVFSNIGL